jgi:hypothetical protein
MVQYKTKPSISLILQIANSTMVLKKGSMKSLSIKIPLKLKSCEIKIEELELIIAPYITTDIPILSFDCTTSSSLWLK